ncbi:MAG: uroporphyrinogen-III synthase [Gammaproteobacteria bacterium]|nr:uroporphyrinogen-III synthase [Gammaproteobacteria bacterium]
MRNAKSRVLVTRPAGQAARLCGLLEAAGHVCIRLPAIEILEASDNYRLEAVTDALEDYDLAIFVSINAVKMGVEFILNHRDWPASTRIATVGASSAEALLQYGLYVNLLPEHQYNSEALLALDELQDMSGHRVVIFRGNGGREVLRETLLARGAEVDYVEVYHRKCPDVDAQRMQALLQPGYLDCITITSNEALQNLVTMAGPEGRPLLLRIPLVVMGGRQATLAQQLGFVHAPLIAANASDEAIFAAVQQR